MWAGAIIEQGWAGKRQRMWQGFPCSVSYSIQGMVGTHAFPCWGSVLLHSTHPSPMHSTSAPHPREGHSQPSVPGRSLEAARVNSFEYITAVGSMSSGFPTQNGAAGQIIPLTSPTYRQSRQEGQQETFTAITDQCQNSSPWFEGLWPHSGLSRSVPGDPEAGMPIRVW